MAVVRRMTTLHKVSDVDYGRGKQNVPDWTIKCVDSKDVPVT